jgi:hypothetical protein
MPESVWEQTAGAVELLAADRARHADRLHVEQLEAAVVEAGAFQFFNQLLADDLR